MADKEPPSKSLPERLRNLLNRVTAKRARTVIDHILEYGYITTEDLRDEYGYDHPPRAARDVREEGIPLETFYVKGSHGRDIAAYRFGDLTKIRSGKIGGRKAWPKNFKADLIKLFGARCAVCFTDYEPRYLQIDHCVPYEVGGDPTTDELQPEFFMLLCGSCNRAKSWSCEHCKNWQDDHDCTVCEACYWASPNQYSHVGLRLIRRLDITWSEDEIADYERIVSLANEGIDRSQGQKGFREERARIPDFVKKVLRKTVDDELA